MPVAASWWCGATRASRSTRCTSVRRRSGGLPIDETLTLPGPPDLDRGQQHPAPHLASTARVWAVRVRALRCGLRGEPLWAPAETWCRLRLGGGHRLSD